MKPQIFLAVLTFLVSSPLAMADEVTTFQSGVQQNMLLELYSSQGCSSCPTAETWLGSLSQHPELWKTLIPVGFHIDYWDHLGWQDPYSSKQFTERQVAYSKLWASRRISTPMFIVNGFEWRGWFTSRAIPRLASFDVGELVLTTSDGRRFEGTFNPQDRAREYVLHVALMGLGITSEVLAGENAGKSLPQDFVVLDYASGPLVLEEETLITQLRLRSVKAKEAPRVAVAAWVTGADELVPLQATGGFLE